MVEEGAVAAVAGEASALASLVKRALATLAAEMTTKRKTPSQLASATLRRPLLKEDKNQRAKQALEANRRRNSPLRQQLLTPFSVGALAGLELGPVGLVEGPQALLPFSPTGHFWQLAAARRWRGPAATRCWRRRSIQFRPWRLARGRRGRTARSARRRRSQNSSGSSGSTMRTQRKWWGLLFTSLPKS